jgi:hypothetical protein
MKYDLRPYTEAFWRDSILLGIAAALAVVIGASLAALDYRAIASQPFQSTSVLCEIVIVAGIVGGTYSLVIMRVSLTLREAVVSAHGIRLNQKNGRSSEILWGQRTFRVLDDSHVKRFETLSRDDPRSHLRYRLIYSQGILILASPIPEGMAREILSTARQAGLFVKERVVPAGPKSNETEYTLQRR